VEFVSALVRIVFFIILIAAAGFSAKDGVQELRRTPHATRDYFIAGLLLFGAVLWAVLAILVISAH
jgi:hypothetical protein